MPTEGTAIGEAAVADIAILLGYPDRPRSNDARGPDMTRKERISQILTAEFKPFHLQLEDETSRHNVPPEGESHFRLTLVCEAFAGQPLVKRQRAVNALLREEFQSGLHALAMHTLTPEEWFAKGGQAPDSPPCLGGSKAD